MRLGRVRVLRKSALGPRVNTAGRRESIYRRAPAAPSPPQPDQLTRSRLREYRASLGSLKREADAEQHPAPGAVSVVHAPARAKNTYVHNVLGSMMGVHMTVTDTYIDLIMMARLAFGRPPARVNRSASRGSHQGSG